jgi:hypothetical protein
MLFHLFVIVTRSLSLKSKLLPSIVIPKSYQNRTMVVPPAFFLRCFYTLSAINSIEKVFMYCSNIIFDTTMV